MNTLFKTVTAATAADTPAFAASDRDRSYIRLTGYVLEMFIGIHPHERERRQRVRVSLEVEISSSRTWDSGRIEDTLSYDRLKNAVDTLAAQQHYELAENFADALADSCRSFPETLGAEVTVDKLDIYDGASAGVRFYRCLR